MNKLALLLAVGAASAAHAQNVYSYGGSPVPIPDSPDGTCGGAAIAEVNVPDSFTIGQVQASFYIPHPCQGDLKISLLHVETGRQVTLVSQAGTPELMVGFMAPDYGTPSALFTLSDGAPTGYDTTQVPQPGIAQVTGSWIPQNPLSAFNSEPSAGHWQLMARDCAGMDTGTIVGFSLTLSRASSCYVNCDGSSQSQFLNVADLSCFLNRFAAGCSTPQNCYPNCDNSTQAPFLNVQDFTCFLQKFAAGCTAP